MADAMEMMILSILGPALHCDWMVPPWQQALLTTVCLHLLTLWLQLWSSFSSMSAECDSFDAMWRHSTVI